MIGLLSDSHGDLDAFDVAYELLRGRGARRFIFAGGDYADLDAWLARRSGRSDADFLEDVTSFLSGGEPSAKARAPVFTDREPEDPKKLAERFLRVAEPGSSAHRDGGAPRKAMDLIGDALCCVVYDKNELQRDDLINATVFVHGGEAEPKVVQIGPRYFVTPGRLVGSTRATCGLLEVVERNLRFSAFALDGTTVVDGQVLTIDRRTKLTVK